MPLTSIENVQFREATAADAPAMALSHVYDPSADAADPRMAAYLDGQHPPQQALLPRVAYLALVNDQVIGYTAGHRTTRHGCAGEVQYLFVSAAFRRRGVATELIRLLAQWFRTERVQKVCVALAGDSPADYRPFYESMGASPLRRFWYGWEDVGTLL